MDSRLIFLHRLQRSNPHVCFSKADPPARHGGWGWRKPEDVYDSEVFRRTDEKSRCLTKRLPVLKLTQVGEMNILRRSR